MARVAIGRKRIGYWVWFFREETLVYIVESVQGQSKLFDIVRTAHAVGCFTDFLNRGQQQTNKNSNDGNDYEKLDQRESGATGRTVHGIHGKSPVWVNKMSWWERPSAGGRSENVWIRPGFQMEVHAPTHTCSIRK